MSTFSQVKRCIDRLDPHQLLASHAPSDEYDAESRKISEQITYDDAPETIAQVIADVFAAAFSEPESPARFYETAVCIRRALCYEYYGALSDQFEYGTLSDAECIPAANVLIRQSITEADGEVQEMMLHAVWMLVSHRNTAAMLDLRPLIAHRAALSASAAVYLPDILEASGDPQYRPLTAQLRAQLPD